MRHYRDSRRNQIAELMTENSEMRAAIQAAEAALSKADMTPHPENIPYIIEALNALEKVVRK